MVWSAVFNPDMRFEPDTSKSPEWNRGAYLTEALAHCGECHTPRNLAFALDNHKKFAGALTAGWRAFNISSDKATGIGAWRDDDLIAYLSIGHAAGHGTASGPMGEAVDQSLSQLAPEDIRAMVAYLRSVPATASPDLPAKLAQIESHRAARIGEISEQPGGVIGLKYEFVPRGIRGRWLIPHNRHGGGQISKFIQRGILPRAQHLQNFEDLRRWIAIAYR